MIKAVFKFTIQEGKIEEFKRIAALLVAETRKDFGCVAYELFQDMSNNKILTLIEEWESQEAMDTHKVSKHSRELGPMLDPTFEKEPEINFYGLVL